MKLAGDEEPGGAAEHATEAALTWLERLRARSPFGEQGIGRDRRSSGQRIGGDALPEGPELRDRAGRRRGLPAMMAALIAPIEMPATQSGWMSASASAA